MALTPFGFMLGEPAFGPSSRELCRLNKGFDGWTSALMPAFDQLPVQAAATTAMVGFVGLLIRLVICIECVCTHVPCRSYLAAVATSRRQCAARMSAAAAVLHECA